MNTRVKPHMIDTAGLADGDVLKYNQATDKIEGGTSSGGIADAPGDGQEYIRKDGAWAVHIDKNDGESTVISSSAALARRSTSTSGTTGAWGTVPVETSAFDDAGFLDLANNRIVIPTGVSRAKVQGGFKTNNHTPQITVKVSHYASDDTTKGNYFSAAGTGTYIDGGFNAATPLLEVEEGDYFQLHYFTSDSSFTLEDGYLGIEAAGRVGTSLSIAASVAGTFTTDSEKLFTYLSTDTFTLPQDLVNSRAYVGTAPADGTATFDIQINGVNQGAIDFLSGSQDGTFTWSADVVINSGDRLTVVSPATSDSVIADLSLTLLSA